ncbi:hypothetical protein PR048_027070 [Dryococelus australis]|uniref:ABC transmembrane type-1 domain-containing protein n=1 Tax=Dryococelus australis TaxID=614101 RepID=A0ABQ9GEE1_9NEOP|nr:hypothetical protein PR048_027070 [Dryococelus australis]
MLSSLIGCRVSMEETRARDSYQVFSLGNSSEVADPELAGLLSSQTCVYVYMALVASALLLMFVRSVAFVGTTLRNISAIHDSMFHSVMYTCIQFFNTNSPGETRLARHGITSFKSVESHNVNITIINVTYILIATFKSDNVFYCAILLTSNVTYILIATFKSDNVFYLWLFLCKCKYLLHVLKLNYCIRVYFAVKPKNGGFLVCNTYDDFFVSVFKMAVKVLCSVLGRILNRFSKDLCSIDETLLKSLFDASQVNKMSTTSCFNII